MFQTRDYLLSVLSIAFPCLLGIFAMHTNNVSAAIWLRNISAILLLGITTFLFARYTRHDIKLNAKGTICIAILLLLAAFFEEGIEGVHRWVSISAVSLNVSMAVIPMAIFAIYHLFKSKELMFSVVGILSISLILFFQPDASQLTGFAFAMLFCLFGKDNAKTTSTVSKILICGALAALTLLSWKFLDAIQPVDYIEGILSMLGGISSAFYILGMLAMLLMPVPMIVFSSQNMKGLSVCIAVYYWAITLSTFWGNFPVPFMGYGISPIIGYFVMVTFFLKCRVS